MTNNTEMDIDMDDLSKAGPDEAFLLFSPPTIESVNELTEAARAEIGQTLALLGDVIVRLREKQPMLRIDVSEGDRTSTGERVYGYESSMVSISAGSGWHKNAIGALCAGMVELCRFTAREADGDNAKLDTFVTFIGETRDMLAQLEADLEKAFPAG